MQLGFASCCPHSNHLTPQALLSTQSAGHSPAVLVAMSKSSTFQRKIPPKTRLKKGLPWNRWNNTCDLWICYILSCREKHTRHIQASSLDQGISRRFLVPTMAITFCCISGTSTRKIPTQRKTISGRMTTTTQQLQHKQTSQGSSSQPLKKMETFNCKVGRSHHQPPFLVVTLHAFFFQPRRKNHKESQDMWSFKKVQHSNGMDATHLSAAQASLSSALQVDINIISSAHQSSLQDHLKTVRRSRHFTRHFGKKFIMRFHCQPLKLLALFEICMPSNCELAQIGKHGVGL